MDEEALTDFLRDYLEEIYDLVFLKGDLKEAEERMEVISKFEDDHEHQHPDAFINALFGADGHLIAVLLFLYEHSQKKQAITQLCQIEQSLFILELLDSYSETEDPSLLETVRLILRNSIKNVYQDMDSKCKEFALECLRKRCQNHHLGLDQSYYNFVASRLEEII